eukprot:SAG11_NODE_4095_length_2069_cov_1.606907_2_plen_426_part_01
MTAAADATAALFGSEPEAEVPRTMPYLHVVQNPKVQAPPPKKGKAMVHDDGGGAPEVVKEDIAVATVNGNTFVIAADTSKWSSHSESKGRALYGTGKIDGEADVWVKLNPNHESYLKELSWLNSLSADEHIVDKIDQAEGVKVPGVPEPFSAIVLEHGNCCLEAIIRGHHRHREPGAGGLGILPVNLLIEFSRQAVQCVAFLHSNRLVHTQLHPGQFISVTTPFGPTLKLTDLHTVVNRRTACDPILDLKAWMYAAPERAADEPYVKADRGCDLWALGMTIYSIWNPGGPLFEDFTVEEIKEKLRSKNEICLGQNLHCGELLEKVLVREPINRLTAEDMLKERLFNPFQSLDLAKKIDDLIITVDEMNDAMKDTAKKLHDINVSGEEMLTLLEQNAQAMKKVSETTQANFRVLKDMAEGSSALPTL